MNCYNCGPGPIAADDEKVLCERCQTLFEFRDGKMTVRKDVGERALTNPAAAVHAAGAAMRTLITGLTNPQSDVYCPDHGAPHCAECAREARREKQPMNDNDLNREAARPPDWSPTAAVEACGEYKRPYGTLGGPCLTCGHPRMNHVQRGATVNVKTPPSYRPGDQKPPIPNNLPSMHDLLMKDIEARKQLGLERYHSLLQPHNGRSFLLDAYQELLDLLVYLRGKMYEEEFYRLKPEPGTTDKWLFVDEYGQRWRITETRQREYPFTFEIVYRP